MSQFFEDEAEVSEDEGKAKRPADSSDEEEEDDDAEDPALKDFIRDDEEVEEDKTSDKEDSDDNIERKRKRSASRDDDEEDIDEDDYDLIEENLGVKIRKKKKLTRVKLDSDDEDQVDDQQVPEAREAIEKVLFEDVEEEESEGEDIARTAARDAAAEVDDEDEEDEESDVNDFIVDDEGVPMSRKKKSKKKGKSQISDAALAEAQDLFGADFELDDLTREYDQGEDEDEEDDYDEMDEEDADFIEEDGEVPYMKKKKAPKKPKAELGKRKVLLFEPSQLEKSHYTEEDEQIKKLDVPERFQLRHISVQKPEENEISEEANWISCHMFQTHHSISEQLIFWPSHNGTGTNPYDPRNSRETPSSGMGLNETAAPTQENVLPKLRDILKLMRDQFLEVPFIHTYRREYCEGKLADIYELWKVWKSDERWTQLFQRKRTLKQLFSDMRDYLATLSASEDEDRIAEIRPLEEMDIQKLLSAETMIEVEDTYQHFLLHYGHYIEDMNYAKKRAAAAKRGEGEENSEETTKLKRPQRKQLYHVCIKNKIYNLANRFGLPPEKFGENIANNYQMYEPTPCSSFPEEIAIHLICDAFHTRQAVVNAAVYMVAQQLSHDPTVRKEIRQAYEERVSINVRPTVKGRKVIDESHPLFPVKYLKNKHPGKMRDAEFLLLHDAEGQGLVTITFVVNVVRRTTARGVYPMGEERIEVNQGEEHKKKFIEDLSQLYWHDEFSDMVAAWNELRARTVEHAVDKILFPTMEKEMREKLLKEAQEFVINKCVHTLHSIINVQPYSPKDEDFYNDEDEEDYDIGARVVSVAYPDDFDSPTFAVNLDKNGVVKDYVRLSHFMRSATRPGIQKNLKEHDLLALNEFILRVKPHAIVVCVSSTLTVRITKDIEKILVDLESQEGIPHIPVQLVSDDVALVYQNCTRAAKEFPDYPKTLLQAISAGRRLQNPLVEFSQLCENYDDLLSFKFHSLQNLVAKEELLEALLTEFVCLTNKVGVDINKALEFSHFSSIVQFISGLGSRKASHMMQTLQRKSTKLFNRTQLVTLVKMGPKIFVNCAGFIKIDISSLDHQIDIYLDPLDGTRIHPETYEWARKMAVDALEYDESMEEAGTAKAVEEIMETPDKLESLDLDAFADELERQGYGKKNLTLYDINSELSKKFSDKYREHYVAAEQKERFQMLTKETEETLYPGKLMLVTVRQFAHTMPKPEELSQVNPRRDEDTKLWTCPFCEKQGFVELEDVWHHFDNNFCPGRPTGVRVTTENGLNGFINMKHLSDNPVSHPSDKMKEGITFYARILMVNLDQFSVDLTCRTSDLKDLNGEFAPAKDEAFDEATEMYDKKLEETEAEKRKRSKQYIKRVIVHPSFANVTWEECKKKLEHEEQGECLFRPSSKGASNLTCTWKVDEGIFQHIDIIEENKENSFSIGQALKIRVNSTREDPTYLTFEDLDEVIATHIKPMAMFARELITYKYYHKPVNEGDKYFDHMLTYQKTSNPSKIPYVFTPSMKFPGYFELHYMPRQKTLKEYVGVTPTGFKYRGTMFQNLNGLLGWFKVHFRERPPGATVRPTPSLSARQQMPPPQQMIQSPYQRQFSPVM